MPSTKGTLLCTLYSDAKPVASKPYTSHLRLGLFADNARPSHTPPSANGAPFLLAAHHLKSSQLPHLRILFPNTPPPRQTLPHYNPRPTTKRSRRPPTK